VNDQFPIHSEVQISKQITAALMQVLGNNKIALHEPKFNGNESIYLQKCLASTFVSSVGPFVNDFEDQLKKYTGSKHAIAVVNGTAALHIALLVAGIKPDEEVILPALTFVATANAVRYCNAIPHFVDTSYTTLGMDPKSLGMYLSSNCVIRSGQCINKISGRVIRAVIPMHTFGHPVQIDKLLDVANEFHLTVIEDAAESLGSTWRGQHTGTFGLLGTLSFNGNKIITTGGGGAVLTDNSELASRAKHLSTTAKIAHRWAFDHDEIGFNYRMPNINAALGLAQLEQLSGFIASKRLLFEQYKQVFKDSVGVKLFSEPIDCFSNYWLQTLIIDSEFSDQREEILNETNNSGFMTRPCWNLLPTLIPYKYCPCAPIPVATDLVTRIINIPSSSFLS